MPTVVRFYIRTALVYLALAVAMGALLAGRPELGPLQPVYFHLFMAGWVTQLIFGVAAWMFPPLSRERPRGDERLLWAIYGALNVGLVLRVIAEPLNALRPGVPWAPMLALSALLQVAAGWAFVAHLWPRVKGPKA